MAQRKAAPLVGVVMGSDSDWEIMRHAVAQLDAFGIPNEPRVLSAHRMPDDMFEYAEDAGPRGLRVIIAGAGGAAHLPACSPPRPSCRCLACRYLEVPARRRFAAVDRADAQGHSGGHVRDR
jgi:5-(carboxyamino)imidazole ribonucleotide mutase